MVGVPGRSKACHTCKQRRISCGLQRPSCAQCVKSNQVCAGYTQERIFVVGRGSSYHPQQKKTPKLDKAVKHHHSHSNNNKGIDRSGDAEPVPVSPSLSPLEKRLALFQPSVTATLYSPSAYRQQLLYHFIHSHVPVDQPGPEGRPSWLLMLPDMPSLTHALETATMAVCTARMGRDRADPSMVHESLKLYTQGLHRLQRALWDPELMYADETLAACVVLALYEIFECPAQSRRAYVSHQHGCARLVRLRGPARHASGLGHQVFLQFRIHCVLEALKNHEPTFLSEQTWLQAPWATEPKQPFDRLFDFFLLAPALYGQVDQLGALDDRSSLRASLHIIHRCWQLDADLERFYDELVAASAGPLYWTQPSRQYTSPPHRQTDGDREADDDDDDDRDRDTVFPDALHFPDLGTAVTLMYLWSTQLMLWSGLCLLYQHVAGLHRNGATTMTADTSPTHSQDDSPSICQGEHERESERESEATAPSLPPLAHRTTFLAAAHNICRSVEYCTQAAMQRFGPRVAAAPLQIALETMRAAAAAAAVPPPSSSSSSAGAGQGGDGGGDGQRHAREVRWAEAALARIAGTGLRILRYV